MKNTKSIRLLANIAHALFSPNRRMRKLSRVLFRNLLPATPTLLIVSMPKSGSTFLASVLREITGYRGAFLGDHIMSQQDLSEAAVIDSLMVPVVVNQHCSATKPTCDLIKSYNLKVVFLHRNLEDQMMSILDKLDRDPWITPSYAAGPEFRSLPRESQLDHIISLCAARYVESYAFWYTEIEQNRIDGMRLSYEDMISDKPRAISRVAGFFGLDTDQDAINEALRKIERSGQTRFNKGVSGRGKTGLKDRHKQALLHLTKPFPWVDFSPIGLEKAEDQSQFLAQAVRDVSV